MSDFVIDIKANLRASPYLEPGPTAIGSAVSRELVTVDQELQKLIDSINDPESVANKIIASLDALSAKIAGLIPNINQGENNAPGDDTWKVFSLADFKPLKVVISGLDKAIGNLGKVTNLLTKVLNIIAFFASSFGSFSKIISALITFAQQKVNNFVQDFKGGVYANVVAPPAFYANYSDLTTFSEQFRGGFNGFLTRLQVSLNNPNDINRPDFTDDATVGGMVIMIDTESLDEIWGALKQLASMFDFVKLFGLNLSPPVPKGLTGRCGYFTKDENKPDQPQIFGIKLEWEASPLATSYKVYRSKTQGGTLYQNVPYLPSGLMEEVDENGLKQPGLLPVVKDMIFSLHTGNSVNYPTRDEYRYEDSTFNKGEPVTITSPAVSGSIITFIDEFVDANLVRYYYVVKSASLGITSANSQELPVLIKTCNDTIDLADIIPQPNGTLEFVALDYGAIGSWSKFEIILAFPWLKDLAKIINDMLEGLKGMVNDTSEALMKFINQIADKIRTYIGILNVISFLLTALKSFVLGPSFSLLNLPPFPGGPRKFVERIRRAKTVTPFSDENGITIGLVIMYAGNEIVAKAIKAIFSLISK